MKRYEDSIVSYRCTGCGVSIYNASKKLWRCSECGYRLIRINKPVKEGDKELWK